MTIFATGLFSHALLLHYRSQLRQRTHLVLPMQQQVEHRHEVRLAGTESAVLVVAPALGRIDSSLDEAKSVIEVPRIRSEAHGTSTH